MGVPDRRLPPSNQGSSPVSLSSIDVISNNSSSRPALDFEFDNTMLDSLQDLSLKCTTRFFGKYSAVMVHQATLQLKHDYITGSSCSLTRDFPPMPPVSNVPLLFVLKCS